MSEATFRAGWQPATYYPDPAIEALIDASRNIAWLAAVERLATGFRWCEGPVWFGDGRYLLWSDIPNDRILGGRRKPARSASSASRPTSPTATPATARAGWSPASMAAGASPAPNTTARSPCWWTASTASGSTRPTTWWSSPTARSGSPIRRSASWRLRGPARRAGTAQQPVPVRSRDRRRTVVAGGHRRAERAGLFARREQALCGREPRARPGRSSSTTCATTGRGSPTGAC